MNRICSRMPCGYSCCTCCFLSFRRFGERMSSRGTRLLPGFWFSLMTAALLTHGFFAGRRFASVLISMGFFCICSPVEIGRSTTASFCDSTDDSLVSQVRRRPRRRLRNSGGYSSIPECSDVLMMGAFAWMMICLFAVRQENTALCLCVYESKSIVFRELYLSTL